MSNNLFLKPHLLWYNLNGSKLSMEIQWLIAGASAIAAWLALLLSLLNFRTSRRALRLAEKQDDRRAPSLALYLGEGFFISQKSGGRVYAFLLSVSNRSDSNNAVASVFLRLTYRASGENDITVNISCETEAPAFFRERNLAMVPLPARIDAHQTSSGWFFFQVSEEILRDSTVERLKVIAIDSHDQQAEIEPLITRELSDALSA
jgi:hypothetical protein